MLALPHYVRLGLALPAFLIIFFSSQIAFHNISDEDGNQDLLKRSTNKCILHMEKRVALKYIYIYLH